MTALADVGFAVELSGLTKQFGRETAVEDLSLRVQRGSTFGLIGPNGAGKTTTIRMLMGLMRPTHGSVKVLGRDVFADPLTVKQKVGYVPDQHHIDRWMRVREVLDFCKSVYDAWNESTCRELMELFELNPDKKVKQLSKGMLTKLSLVLAVSHEPELLILDEPMSGLDPLGREEFLDGVLRTICERGQTVIFSTHSLDDVQRLADTVGILHGGKLLVHRNIEELLTSTKRIRATLTNGKPPAKLPKNILWEKHQNREWLVTVSNFTPEMAQEIQSQPGVEHVEVEDIGLEDLFKDFIRGRKGTL